MGRPSRLPGTDVDDQLVCHVDIDCFYAACERLREPALRGQPVVVGMGYEPGDTIGAVATASYEAREYGVESAQAISTALERLPRKHTAAKRDDLDVAEAAFYRPVDMEYYESVAADIKAILDERATVLREVSIDEAYLDVSEETDWESVEGFARAVKAAISEEVGLTASVGVAPTMSAAKVASDHDKPDGLVVVRPGDVAGFFAPLDVESVHGVGPVTADRLREAGIETAGDLANADPADLDDWFGERGRRIYRFARGEDERSVEPRGQPKSLSRESAFAGPTDDPDRQHDRLQTLSRAVATRAGSRDVLYQTISIKVVTPPYDVQTRARSLPGPVADERLVEEVATELFEEFQGSRVRKLGVRVANLSFTGESQSKLGEWADTNDGDPTDNTAAECRRSSRQRPLTDFE
ncbi:DNA polymerase IV [Halovenus salina]|uniref:DNA polymerase IV n=1 Tax=Halovenus salina TaxID=1510225 RepID=A0ABD5VV60_9EURY|nr:DNA polymerase IV [Halovenus salina]